MIDNIIYIFSVLKLSQWAWEGYLQRLNQNYYSADNHQSEVKKVLQIDSEEFDKTFRYTKVKDRFGFLASSFDVLVLLLGLHLGFFGWWEQICLGFFTSPQMQGIAFLMGLSVFGQVLQWPWDFYQTFVIEESFGFNKQLRMTWAIDQMKMMLISFAISLPILGAVLWVMESYPSSWWWLASSLLVVFMLLTSWLFPVLISPLFNKFKPLEEGELKQGIAGLCSEIGFEASEVSIMDASIRSSHGNAYFTGLFKDKKIVLFDTLVSSMSTSEILSVLAHELGHFKCHHIKKRLCASVVMVFAVFLALWSLSQQTGFTSSFGLQHQAFSILFVASLWWPLFQIVLNPLLSQNSRKHEFEADRFAMTYTKELGEALKKLSKHNHSMPLCHPLYSKIYHSHPPILERLAAL